MTLKYGLIYLFNIILFVQQLICILQICSNGLVSLDTEYTNPTPTRNTSTLGSRTFLAPYFADIDRQTSGHVYYRTYNTLTANANNNDEGFIDIVNDLVARFDTETDHFDANFFLLATWEDQTSTFLKEGVCTKPFLKYRLHLIMLLFVFDKATLTVEMLE